MTSIWVDSRKRVAGTDSDFKFDVGETVHLQGSARLGVFNIRVADTFLSTDRGNRPLLARHRPGHSELGSAAAKAYTGVRLAAWTATLPPPHVESRNELEVAHDGNRLILNDQELRLQFSRQQFLPARRHAQQAPEHQQPAVPAL